MLLNLLYNHTLYNFCSGLNLPRIPTNQQCVNQLYKLHYMLSIFFHEHLHLYNLSMSLLNMNLMSILNVHMFRNLYSVLHHFRNTTNPCGLPLLLQFHMLNIYTGAALNLLKHNSCLMCVFVFVHNHLLCMFLCALHLLLHFRSMSPMCVRLLLLQFHMLNICIDDM